MVCSCSETFESSSFSSQREVQNVPDCSTDFTAKKNQYKKTFQYINAVNGVSHSYETAVTCFDFSLYHSSLGFVINPINITAKPEHIYCLDLPTRKKNQLLQAMSEYLDLQ